MAVLWNTFDTHRVCVPMFLKKFEYVPHILEIHATNEANRHTHKLARYEFLATESTSKYNANLVAKDPKTLEAVRKNTQKIVDYVAKYGNVNTAVMVSTGLEDKFSNAAWRVLAGAMREVLPPRFLLVRSPQKDNDENTDYSLANAIELHGAGPWWSHPGTPSHCVINNDGFDIDFKTNAYRNGSGSTFSISGMLDQIRYYKGSGCLFFIWWTAPQADASRRFVEPRRRDFVVHSQDVHAVNKLLRKTQ